MKVDIYKNLHLSRKMGRNMFSVKNRSTGRVEWKQSGGIALNNVLFLVSKKGNQRVRSEKSKNVHAFVRGHVIDSEDVPTNFDGTIFYNPYLYDTFVDYSTREPIHEASYVWIDENGIIYYKK
mgnify:CR=1 FL=1|tara:strand:- start:52 stop:420 length:369 start_codon:yes stop_codon:yes gene_type:complete